MDYYTRLMKRIEELVKIPVLIIFELIPLVVFF
jgi:hypothetical protein